MSSDSDIVIPVPDETVQKTQDHGQKVVAFAKGMQITKEEDLAKAQDFLITVVDAEKKVGGLINGLIKPFQLAVKSAKAKLDPLLAPYEEANAIVRDKMKVYFREVNEKKEAEAKAERERREAAEKKNKTRMNKLLELGFVWDGEVFCFEELKVFPVEIQSDSDEIWGAKVFKMTEEIEKLRIAGAPEPEAPKEAEPLPELTEPEPVEKADFSHKTEAGSVGTMKRWTYDKNKVDLMQVPREFLTLDTVKLNAAIRSGERNIAGLVIFEEEAPIVRSK